MAPSYSPQDQPGGQSIAEAVTPEIQALAGGLENDPVQIYNYVHDYISYVHYFGSKKGAQLTLLERSGNDFDQCALLVALLRAAGYTSADNNLGYQFGIMAIPYSVSDGSDYDLQHWLCLSLLNTNWGYTSNYLANLFYSARGFPAYGFTGDNNTLKFHRVWVTLSISGTNYYLDPAFKVSEPIDGISLPSAMNFSSSSLLSAAQGTDTGNYVTNLNEGAIRNNLGACTTNLLGWLQNNNPNASVREILSGWGRYMDPWYETTLPQSLAFKTSGTIANWTYEPTNLMSALSISFAGTNYQWFMPQLQGQRLTLAFDGSGTAQLWQDDTLLVERSTTSADTNVVLAVTHPFGYWNWATNGLVRDYLDDQIVTNSYQRTNATYALVYAFEPDWGWLRDRQNRLDAYRQQGLADTSLQVVAETLNVMGLSWMLQTDYAERALAAQLGILRQYHHRVGRMAQEGGRGYYVDAYMQCSGEASDAGLDAANTYREDQHFDLTGFFGSALEHGLIEQLQATNLTGASTVKMLQIANTNGQAIYLASGTNWTSVRSHLANYPNLSNLDNLIGAGYRLLLPQNGSNHVAGAGSWAGCAYEARLNTGTSSVVEMAIGGGYQGGYVSDPAATANSPYVSQSGQAQPQFFTAAPVSTRPIQGADPINLADGTFELETTDLSFGQAEPRGISFSRYYNGRRRYSNPAGMAPGWVHNYCVSAVETSAPEAGLGQTTPAQMAPMLVATAAAIALYNGAQPNPKNWMVTALIAKWGIDQLTRKAVSVSLGHQTLQFVRQPDGTFTPPANCTWSLSNNGTYALQQRHGNTFNFDSLGRLATIVDPYSQTLSVDYLSATSNLPEGVTDWSGLPLNFHYIGGQLAWVNDAYGRWVTYGYANGYGSPGDLTSVTDVEYQTSTYAYDTNHQITATFDALNRLVVSNRYDTAGHVTTQYTQGDTNKTWQIYWAGFRNAQRDPAGGRRVYYYDSAFRPWESADELGNVSYTYYDGQDHVVWTGTPLGEWTEFDYDGNHNLVQRFDPLGYSRQFIYDNQNNLIRSVDERENTNRFGYNANFSLTGSTNGAGDWVVFDYNGDGTLHTRTDLGGATTYAYSIALGQLTTITHPGNLGSEGFSHNYLGDVLSHTNARGFVTTFQYNWRRQLTNTVAPTNLIVKLAYDAVGNQQSVTDARGFTTTNFWSPTRHLTGTVFPATPQGVPAITNLYDNRDWLLRTINPQQSTINYSNDLAGRLLSLTDPLSRTTRYGYDADGRRTAATNAAQEVILQQLDFCGQLTNLIDPAAHTIKRGYDQAGNQIELTNRNLKKWQFHFDAANRLTNTITPLGKETRLTYDARGLVSIVREPSTQTTTNFYDPRARLTNVTDAVGVRLYTFDANNNLTKLAQTINSQQSTLNFTYDAYDRATTFTNADGYVIQYRSDASGNLTNLVYPGGSNVYYAYDSLNRLTNVTDWANRKTTITYDLASRVRSITRPNNTVRLITYDAAGETTNIIEKTTTGFPIAFFTLGWTNSGRVAWEFGAPLSHAYTPPYRSMAYNDDNQITTLNNTNTLAYDSDGNMTTGPLTNSSLVTYGYDARNRLLAVGSLQYGYDPAGNRTSITNGTNVVRFVVNPNAALPQALIRSKPDGSQTFYVYGVGLLYEVNFDYNGTELNTRTYHNDYRGSTVALTDANGLPTDRIEYSAYGMVTYRAGTTDTPFLYNGRYGVMTDPNGLYYMRARYYNPYICRFINPDPVGFAGGLNWYCYADGNPISLNDPFGLWAGLDDLAFTGGGAVIGLASQGISDLVSWKWSGLGAYGYSAAAGAAGGESTLYAGPIIGGAVFGGTKNVLNQSKQMAEGQRTDFSYVDLAGDTAIGAGSAYVAEFVPVPGIQGLNAGRGSFQAVSRQVVTKLENGTIQNISTTTAGKVFVNQAYTGLSDATVHGVADAAKDTAREWLNGSGNETTSSPTGK
jgi:RHS repeat-associated protein